MKNKIKHNAFLIGLATVIVALDQWTKILVTHKMAVGEGFSPIAFLGDFFTIVHWRNTGAAFGLFQNANTILLVVSIIIAIAVLFYYQVVNTKDWLAKVSLTLIFAGAAGNIIDRIKFGYVIDFLSFGHFPVFNVADSAVTVGVFLMVFHYLIEEKNSLKAIDKKTNGEDCNTCASDKELEKVVYKVEDSE
jgi:signal peptidase II